MPQVVSRRSNFITRAVLFGSVFFLAGLVFVLYLFFHSAYITRVGIPVEQPIPFPHDLHVRGLSIDCRFCHTSVEESAFAGFPPIHTCMTCHSHVKKNSPVLVLLQDSWRSGVPIQWNRVNDLGDFTYFSHEIHVAKGVGCETCHGRVDRMGLIQKTESLYMEWCLECHREPEQFIRPREQVFTMGWQPDEDQFVLRHRLVEEYAIAPPEQLDDCSVCHR